MIKFIIDGNNLIGKMPSIYSLPKNLQREKLAHLLDRFFAGKKNSISLHFDGFADLAINTHKLSIHYSENKQADLYIRLEIENAKNRVHLTVVTSDNALKQFAKVCGCKVILSEDFAKQLKTVKFNDEEDKINEINNIDEFKKLFGV